MDSDECGDDSKAECSSEAILFARTALLETIQKMGSVEASENRVLDQPLVRGSDVFNCVPTDVHRSDKGSLLCFLHENKGSTSLTDG